MSEKNENKQETHLQDYLAWRGDLTFAQDPFNEVDNLLLCLIAYIDFSRIPLLRTKRETDALTLEVVCAQLTEKDEQRGLSQLDYIPVMRQAAATARFSAVKMFGFESVRDEAEEMQFDAVSFLLPDHSIFVTFMGTDRSLVGWKEDFNMSFLSSVPAQRRAETYALEMAQACPDRDVRIGGHSKGGNLAVWAAAHLPEEVQDRLLAAYNNDGPGFSVDLLNTEGHRRIAERVHTFVPESSIVGVLLEHAEDYEIIDSSYHAIMQHEPLSWTVVGNRFIRMQERTSIGKLSDDAMRDWLASMTAEERKTFADALFDVLSRGGTRHTLEEAHLSGLTGGAALLRAFAGADEESRRVIKEKLKRLAAEVGEELKKSAEDGMAAAKNGLLSMLPDWIK
ncbi:MAG: DUF2974 domain-containing protein [Oscillospiraceae bacterium]|nr:DUF2974 domain-containing protein [Oscillospiraceae bacterium]